MSGTRECEVRIGSDFWTLRREQRDVPIMWRESEVSNHHIGVAGTTGSGKTHWIRQFIGGMDREDVEIDIFDYHGDIDVPGAESVLFSESTRYGYNPLLLNPDPHYGGVRRAVVDVIAAINSTSQKLGSNQEAVLRNLLLDAFALKGCFPDNPSTWRRREGSEAELRALMTARNWAGLRDFYPTLSDVLAYGRRKLRALWMGIDDQAEGKRALTAFDEYCRAMASFNRLRARLSRTGASHGANSDDPERLLKQLNTLKDKVHDSHRIFIESLDTGRECEEAMKYHSKDVLLSVLTRLDNLVSTAIFNPNPPPFGAARVRRYVLKPLAQSFDELRMFVRFRLSAIFREEMLKGESHGKLRRLIVLDEAKRFNDELPDNPINILTNEARKFGIGLLMAGQSPAQFSSDFLKQTGTMLLLNLATPDWDEACRKLKIDLKELRYLRPRHSGAVRMLERGQTAGFRQVSFVQQ